MSLLSGRKGVKSTEVDRRGRIRFPEVPPPVPEERLVPGVDETTNGKFLTNDGEETSWGEVPQLPSVTGHEYNFLVALDQNINFRRYAPAELYATVPIYTQYGASVTLTQPQIQILNLGVPFYMTDSNGLGAMFYPSNANTSASVIEYTSVPVYIVSSDEMLIFYAERSSETVLYIDRFKVQRGGGPA